MPIVISAGPVRKYETTDTGSTGLIFDYIKGDVNVATLRLSLVNSAGTTVGSATVDVSAASVGVATSYTATIANGLAKAQVSATYTTDSVAANSSKSYTAPTGKIWIIVTDTGTVKDANGINFGTGAIVPAGASVTVSAGTSAANVTIYEADATAVSSTTFTLKVEELDSAGTVRWSQTASISDYPPLTINIAGTVTVKGVL